MTNSKLREELINKGIKLYPKWESEITYLPAPRKRIGRYDEWKKKWHKVNEPRRCWAFKNEIDALRRANQHNNDFSQKYRVMEAVIDE